MLLIVGGSGKFGGEIAEHLLGAGERVRILVPDAKPRDRAESGGRCCFEGLRDTNADLEINPHIDSDVEFVWSGESGMPERLFDGVRRVFRTPEAGHMEAGPGEDFLAAARRAGVRHLVGLSAGINGFGSATPRALARLHRGAERRVASSGLAATFLHPAYFPGGTEGLISYVSERESTYVTARGPDHVPELAPMPEAEFLMLDPRDVPAVAAAVLVEDGHEGRSYILAGPELLTGCQERVGASVAGAEAEEKETA